MFTVTSEWLEKYKTPNGGFLYQQVTAIGVNWPLVSGWKTRVIGKVISEEQRQVFEAGSVSKTQAKKAARELLGLRPRFTKAERRAEAQLIKSCTVKKESTRQLAFASNKIARSIKPDPVTASGVNVASDAFLSTFEWRKVRMMALKKYGPVCQCCGATPATGAIMNVDHIKPRKLFPQLALDVNNLQILCHECNHGKGNWDMTDWRKSEIA